MSMPRVLCIVGPTATGKSEVAEHVAVKLGGEVVSMDSMQVYRGMDIGTAKTPPQDRRCALHMVDVCDPDSDYSVQQFQRDARSCIDKLLRNNQVPVLCGGTGLYLDSVIDEMSFPHGQVGDQRRSAYERIANEQGPNVLHKLLEERDPESAGLIHPNNVRRVVRALEMLDEGVSYAKHHEGLKRREPHYQVKMWALTYPREQLYRRIDRRVDQMFESGLVQEVRELQTKGLRYSNTAGQAIGYKEVLDAINGSCTMDEAREQVKRNTRRYAKRQLSWLRRDGRACWIDASKKEPSEICELIASDWSTA